VTTQSAKNILLTIDVEDWFQVENLRPWFPPSGWGTFPLRVEKNTHRLLDLFDRFSGNRIKATFFVLGWVAVRVPELVREIDRRGHEVASHGFGHIMCRQLDRKALEQDLRRSKDLLEDIIGKEVKGYRAPNFSINDQALKCIQFVGYKYDSSYNSFDKHGRYGRISANDCKTKGITIHLGKEFRELPISNLLLGGQTLPWGGGGYFRFIPLSLFKAGVHKILNHSDTYVFYMHPWEIDPDQPKVRQVKGLSRWRHYINLEKTYTRLSRLIESFKGSNFITCSRYMEAQNRLG
jgi:polysaccharide deacetylase family protein (PEP-CTERM system associated)